MLCKIINSLQFCEDQQHIPEQHNLDFNIAENEAFDGYISRMQIVVSNLRVRDVNVLIFLDFSFRYESVHQKY